MFVKTYFCELVILIFVKKLVRFDIFVRYVVCMMYVMIMLYLLCICNDYVIYLLFV
jgi:hypothetical protein